MKYWIGIFVFLLFLTPVAFSYGAEPLVACDGVYTQKYGGVSCDFCKLTETIHRVIKFVVGILVIVSVIGLAITGIQIAYTGASGGGDALSILKERMSNIIIGFILILASWTLVDTLLKALVSDNTIVNNWRTPMTQLCGEQKRPSYDPNHEATTRNDDGSAAQSNPSGTSVIADMENLQSLREAGVTVASWNGIDGPGRSDRVAPEVVTAAIAMQNAAIAQYGERIFQVTAATTDGVGHSPNSKHYEGIAIDLDPINGYSTSQVRALAEQAGCTFILDHGSHIHCDFR